MATNSSKDTIYIDIDDEITTIIEKVRGADAKIVALVLPKRATVLQSIVNMKLLKRTADADKKHLVLITSESGLMPLAGTVGLYVAKNLQTKPEIPSISSEVDDEPELTDEPIDTGSADFDADAAAEKPVGELATGRTATAAASKRSSEESIETLQLDDDGSSDEDLAAATEDSEAAEEKRPKSAEKPKKDKKLAVPNFNKFRNRLFILVPLLLLIIIGLYLAATVLPKATITIATDTSSINSNMTFTADTAAKTADLNAHVIPAQLQNTQKQGSQQVPATGKQNNGTKATGTVTMTTCITNPAQLNNVPAGTGVSTNGLTYITQQEASFSYAGSGSSCFKFEASDVPIAAQAGGSNYNVSGATFSVAGRSDISAKGSTSGGTDNIVQIVSQADIDNATKQISTQNSDAIKQQLEQQIKQAGLYPLPDTFNAGNPDVKTSANVGDQVSTVTVTQTTKYAMFGVKEADLKALVDNDVKDQIDPSKQVILSEGLSKASFKINSSSDSSVQIALSTTATAGPDLKADVIKQQVAGKRAGEVRSLIGNDPGVKSVSVELSPFWVTKVPAKADKVTVIFQKPQ